SVDEKQVNGPWAYDQTASQSPPGAPVLTAHKPRQSRARTLTLTAAGTWRTVATTTYYNSHAQVTAVDKNPDGSADTCTSTTHSPNPRPRPGGQPDDARLGGPGPRAPRRRPQGAPPRRVQRQHRLRCPHLLRPPRRQPG